MVSFNRFFETFAELKIYLMRLVNNLFKIRFRSFQTHEKCGEIVNVGSIDAKNLISFFEFAKVCFQKKMDRGVQ